MLKVHLHILFGLVSIDNSECLLSVVLACDLRYKLRRFLLRYAHRERSRRLLVVALAILAAEEKFDLLCNLLVSIAGQRA